MASSSKIEHRWKTKAGLEAVVLAVDSGHRCGYVQLPNHLIHLSYDEVSNALEDYYPHGGLTFKGTPQHCDFIAVGFDCAHHMDAKDVNIMSHYYRTHYEEDKHLFPSLDADGVIRTKEFCIEECEALATQLLQTVEA